MIPIILADVMGEVGGPAAVAVVMFGMFLGYLKWRERRERRNGGPQPVSCEKVKFIARQEADAACKKAVSEHVDDCAVPKIQDGRWEMIQRDVAGIKISISEGFKGVHARIDDMFR